MSNSYLRKRATIIGLVVAAALTAVWKTTPRCMEPAGAIPSMAPLPVEAMRTTVCSTVVMHDLQTEPLIGLRDRTALPDLPDDKSFFQNQGNFPGTGGGIPNSGTGNEMSSLPSGIRPDVQREVAGRQNDLRNEGTSWGWLADDVNATVPSAGNSIEGDSRFIPLNESRQQTLGEDPRKALMFEKSDDSFFFQRYPGESP